MYIERIRVREEVRLEGIHELTNSFHSIFLFEILFTMYILWKEVSLYLLNEYLYQ